MDAPSALRNSRSQTCLTLEWADGERQTISHVRLRGACPCSQCRAARLRGAIAVVDENVRLERIALQGYGVQLVFSDGHERGIFPWGYLRELGGGLRTACPPESSPCASPAAAAGSRPRRSAG